MRLTREQLYANFGPVWRVHNRAFTNVLVECRKHFDGDLDAVLILSCIADRTFTAERAGGLKYDEFVDGKRGKGEPGRINTQSIAESTGIPRETVRRKLTRLIKRGWVTRDENGSFRVSPCVARETKPATQASIDHILDVSNAMLRFAVECDEHRGKR